MTQEPMIYRINHVCAMLNISRSTIYRMVKAGALKKVRLGLNSCGITSESISSLLERGAVG
jgi:excisionase family DNA binding protein